MEPGGAWERLLHAPSTWIVVAAVLFVIAVVLLIAGARAGRRAKREQRARVAAAEAAPVPNTADHEDPVTEPAAPGRGPAPAPVDADPVDDEPVTEPAVPWAGHVPAATTPAATTTPAASSSEAEPAAARLLGALVGDPEGALAGVAALERGEEPGRAAVTLLRSGVPTPAVARLCGVDADDLGDLVATTLGIIPADARSVAGRSTAGTGSLENTGSPEIGESAAPAPAPAR